MADKTPVRVVFNSSNVATGMAEFQSGETVPVANGGTGLSSIGSAGQVLKVNGAGNGLEFGAEGDLSITNLVAPTNADLTLRTSGTGGIVLDNITISDNAISTNRSNDDFKINASGSGVINLENLKIGSGATVNTILDEDNFASNDPDALATQQSIKAYVDSAGGISASSTATFTNKTIDADGTGNNISNIDIGNMTAAVIVTESEGIGSNDNDTTLPTSAAVKDYVDNNTGSPTSITEGDSNVTVADSGTGNVTIQVDGTDRLTTTAATTTTATGHTITLGATNTTTGGAIKFLEGTDNGTNVVTLQGPASTANVTITLPAATDTLIGKATTDTLTNKTIDVDNNTVSNIEVDNLKSGVLDTDLSSVSGSDDTLASAKAIKTYVDAQVTASDLDFATDDSTALNIDLDSETLQVSGGANITTSGSGNTITIALDTTLTGMSSVTSTALVTNSISSSDSTAVRIDDALNVDGALDVGAGLTISNGQSITSILDEDAMGSNSASALATQQSIKAYVDAQDANIASDTLTLTNKTFDVEATGNSISNIDVADFKSGVLDTDISSVAGTDTTLASAKAIKTYVDAQVAGKDNTDEITEGSTNLYFTNARADARITNALKDEDNMASDSATHVPSQQSVKAYVDAQDAAIASDTLTFTNKTIDADGTGNNISNIDIGNMTAAVVVLESEGIGSNDNDTTLPTSAAVKDYADTKAVLSGSTDNQITTVTGANAMQGESNLTFNGSTLAVTGAVTVSTTLGVTGASTLDGVTITDNTISTNASNAPLEIIANGTGPVKVTSGGVTFTLPTTDGNAGDFLKTDGSGVLSFASSTGTASDDTRVVIKNNKAVGSSPRTVDYFQATSADMAWYFMALNDLSNDHSSASCFTVCHNDVDAFISGARGGSSGSSNTLPTTSADISSSQVRVKITAPSSDAKISYYKIPISRANTANETAGVTVTTANTDVDSASESIDSFAHASFRAAKYTILIDNDAKTETGVTEALVVHNGTDAFVSQFGTVNTGNNDMITLTAAISGSNVVLSASGLEPNLSLKIHKILLSDSMSAVSNSNQKIIGATTVSSSATAFDNFDLDDAVAAVYYIVGKNAAEGAFSVQEVFCSGAPGEASVSAGPFVSTKATTQLEFTAGFKSDADNSVELSVSSTSGGSTVVNAYRINCLAE